MHIFTHLGEAKFSGPFIEPHCLSFFIYESESEARMFI